MGSLLVVFLRRAYIVEEKLPFPEGVACAEVLRAGAKTANAAPLLYGGIISALLKTSQDIAGFVPGMFSGARWIGGAAIAGSIDISAALLGVGYIVGIRIAMLVFLGGAIAWFVAVPIASASHPELHAIGAYAAATQVWSDEVRYLGVGAMLTGGIVTLWRLRTRIVNALVEGIRVVRAGRSAAATAREDTDLSATAIVIASGLALPVIFALCMVLTGSIALSLAMAVVLAIVGFFATAVAGYLTGLVGASNNPVSGVTVIVLLALALVLKLLGVSPGVGPRLAIMAGAVVCTAAAMAGDSMHDLATGYHVGATPRSLEIAVVDRRDRIRIHGRAGAESAAERVRNRRHRWREGERARRAAGVPDGESHAGRFQRRAAMGHHFDRRRARRASRASSTDSSNDVAARGARRSCRSRSDSICHSD